MPGARARNLCAGGHVEPAMQAARETFPESHIHPAIGEKIASYKKEEVEAVKALVAAHRVVVVGMTQNPYPKKARKLLDEQGVAYEYLGIGSYLGEWRRRLVLKMWMGWPTFPLIFVDGMFVGGFDDLQKLVDSGELAKTLAAPRAS
jgi:monothiol glutaredoxin